MQIFDGSKNRHLIFSAVAFLISRYVEMHAMEDSHLSTVFDGYLDLIFCIFDLYFFEHFRALFSFFLFQHGTVFTVMFTLSITFGTIYTAAFMSIAADRPAMVLIMNYAAKLVVSISESIFFGLHNETKISSLLLIGWLFQVAVTYRGHAFPFIAKPYYYVTALFHDNRGTVRAEMNFKG
ncbi:hypothetical protein T03_14793 [Trichinella britovi]|uniref:Transmembrane protein n=1 Tax=Trichinella britovi TaxID=45882 RepID=A0A0V1DJJ6_TRIBR|nr:hypothetical protein T03_14793 [Trichinella britovi]